MADVGWGYPAICGEKKGASGWRDEQVLFHNKGSETLAQVTHRCGGSPIPGDIVSSAASRG